MLAGASDVPDVTKSVLHIDAPVRAACAVALEDEGFEVP